MQFASMLRTLKGKNETVCAARTVKPKTTGHKKS